MLDKIEEQIEKREKILQEIKEDLKNYIYTVSVMMEETLNSEGKVIIFADKEFENIAKTVQKLFLKTFSNLKGISSVFLEYDININDTEEVFQRQIFSCASKKDMLICFSLDGTDKALLRGLSLGKNLGCRTVAFSGFDGGVIGDFCDISIIISQSDSVVLNEFYLVLGDIIIQTTNSSLSILD